MNRRHVRDEGMLQSPEREKRVAGTFHVQSFQINLLLKVKDERSLERIIHHRLHNVLSDNSITIPQGHIVNADSQIM